MTTKVSADAVQQVRALIIATCQYDEHYFSQGVRALYVVGALKDERDTLASHADPLRRALEKARAQFEFYVQAHMSKSPPDMDKAATNQEFVEMIDAALSSGENNNGE